ncbi:MAG: DHA2 family efflux MFS transporter permease subunit [Chloroflexi bacterium]|nr:DHA2 family efflux MFS transporter permease subunit [Chloroflexota bacterium]
MQQSRIVDPPPRPDRHVIFALLSVSMLTFIMQFGMVAVSLGELTDDLAAPLRWSGWVLTIFMVGQVVALPVSGRLSERFGARSVFAVGLGLFALASLVCAIAPNIFVLIAARAVQGAAGGGLMPSGISLIGEAYGSGRTKAIALYSSIMPFGAVFGPTVGGLIVDHLGWRWTFGLTVPLGLVMCALGLVLLPPGARRAVQRIDLGGIALIAVAITSLVLVLTELGQRDVTPNYGLVAAAGAVCAFALVVLVPHELRTTQPVVDLDLLRRREFASSNVLAFCFGMSWIGAATMIPLYAQEAYGLSVAESGALMSPRAAVMVLVSSIAALAIARTGFRKPLFLGLLGVAGSLFVLSRGIHDPSFAGLAVPNFWWLIVVVGSAGAFFGFANPSMNNASLDLAPERIAAIVGLRGMFMSLGGTLGISLMVMIASRAETLAGGIEIGFAVLAAVLLVGALFVLGIPEPRSTAAVPHKDPHEAPSAGAPERVAAGVAAAPERRA